MAANRAGGDFGSKLRAARERRGLSLRQISNATKISIITLEALEKNDIARLPGGIFSRAFVRSYAIEVGLDPEATIQEFMGQFPHDSVTAGHPTSARVEDHEAVESDRRMASTFLRLLVISIPLTGLIIYFGSAGRRAGRARPVEDRPPVAASAPENAGRADQATPTSAAGAVPGPGVAPAAGPPQVTTPAQTPAPVATPTAARTLAPGTAARGTAAPGPASAPGTSSVPAKPARVPTAAADTQLTVHFTVTKPCWVSATVDGQKAVERLLQPGDEHTLRVRRELVLTADDAAAVQLTLNGAAARPLGNEGEAVTTRLNLTNFKEYLASP